MLEAVAFEIGYLLARLLWTVVGPITEQIFTLALPIEAAMELMKP